LKQSVRYLLILGLTGMTLPAAAAPTLGEVIDTAMQRHPDRRLSDARQEVSEGYRRQADSWLGGDPALGLSWWSDEFNSDTGYRELEAGVTLPLWLPGQRANRRQLADELLVESEVLDRLLRWRVAGAVLEQFWKLRLAESELSLDRKHLESARTLEKSVARRVEAGELPRSELLMARQETLKREAMVQDARTALMHEQAAWTSLTGDAPLPAPFAIEPSPLDHVDEQHPVLWLSNLAVTRAVARVKEARIRRRSNPTLSLYLKRDRGDAQTPYIDSLGAQVTVPFGSSTQNAPALAEARQELAQAEARMARTRRELNLKRQQAWQELQRAGEALALAQRRSELARKRMTMSQRAFELGETDLYLLLQAREQAIDAARELERSRIQHQRAAVRYNLAVGVSPE